MERSSAIGYDVCDRIGEFSGYRTGYYEYYEGEETSGYVFTTRGITQERVRKLRGWREGRYVKRS